MNLPATSRSTTATTQGHVFPIISAHIVGMFGLVIVVGDLIDRIGRRRAIVAGLALMAVSTLALVWFDVDRRHVLALFGLGLGWSFSYVAATAELVTLAGAVGARAADRLLRPPRSDRRGRARAARRRRVTAASARSAWRSAATLWRSSRRSGSSSGADPAGPGARADAATLAPPAGTLVRRFLCDEDLERKAGRDRAPTGTSSTPRGRPWAGLRPRSPTRSAARASRSTRRTSTPATSSSS